MPQTGVQIDEMFILHSSIPNYLDAFIEENKIKPF